jgi:1,4-alpha-glucan branching enzyme
MAKRENKRINKTEKSKLPGKTEASMEFRFFSPWAMNVCVAGEFNAWDTQSLSMKKDKDGIWKAKVRLSPGRYEYKLFADNAWVEDLPDAEAVLNSFGTKNFVISVK